MFDVGHVKYEIIKLTAVFRSSDGVFPPNKKGLKTHMFTKKWL